MSKKTKQSTAQRAAERVYEIARNKKSVHLELIITNGSIVIKKKKKNKSKLPTIDIELEIVAEREAKADIKKIMRIPG